jgi:glycosyltransferase involved in cell wall biosynthesis
MSPKVSVVIPVYNRAVPVRRAIESVLSQTCQDFEVIVVDDASTDDSCAAVSSFADPRITLVRHERNRGGSAARNTGIGAGSAPFVAFLDSDDEWSPTKVQRQLGVFETSAVPLGLVYTGTEYNFADGTVNVEIPQPEADVSRALLTRNVVGGSSVAMIPRAVFETVGGFDESLPSSQDMDLWLRVCSRYPSACIPEPLVKISAGSDPGRITANIKSVLKGRELFLRKYQSRLVTAGVLDAYLRDFGWVHHRLNRDPSSARRCYIDAIKANPLSPSTYGLLLLSYLPLAWLDHAAHLLHKCSGTFVQLFRPVQSAGSSS